MTYFEEIVTCLQVFLYLCVRFQNGRVFYNLAPFIKSNIKDYRFDVLAYLKCV